MDFIPDWLRNKEPKWETSFPPQEVQNFCTGCGKEIEERKEIGPKSLCPNCHSILLQEIESRRHQLELDSYNSGPNFLAIYHRPKGIIGVPIYISKIVSDAMAEAQRLALQQGWKLLRLDIQKTLEDVYRSEDYTQYFKVDKEPLAYDVQKYGEIPKLWTPAVQKSEKL